MEVFIIRNVLHDVNCNYGSKSVAIVFCLRNRQPLIRQQPNLPGHEPVQHGLEHGFQGGLAVFLGGDFGVGGMKL